MSDIQQLLNLLVPERKGWSEIVTDKRQEGLLKSSRRLDHETFIQRFKSKEAPATDAELIAAYNCNGNELAFDILYKRHKNNMLAYLYGILHSWEDAKDVLHNAWEEVLQSFKNNRYREDQDFARWFKSICYHRAIDWKRERSRFLYGNGQLPDHADATLDIEQCLDNYQSEALLQNAFKRLTETERQIVELRIYRNMSLCEIAVKRKITAGAARGIYCKALKKIKNALG